MPHFVPNCRPYPGDWKIPKEENRAVSMVWVLEDDHIVCNQCGQCCGAQGHP